MAAHTCRRVAVGLLDSQRAAEQPAQAHAPKLCGMHVAHSFPPATGLEGWIPVTRPSGAAASDSNHAAQCGTLWPTAHSKHPAAFAGAPGCQHSKPPQRSRGACFLPLPSAEQFTPADPLTPACRLPGARPRPEMQVCCHSMLHMLLPLSLPVCLQSWQSCTRM